MATVGQQLTVPEAGWKRYDDTDANIKYIGDKWEFLTGGGTYLQTHHRTAKANDKVTFNFTGPKIRIIGAYNTQDSASIEITIDEVSYTYSDYSTSWTEQVLVFEKTDLGVGEHCVTITNLQDSKYFTLDAFDIDETGELKPYVEPKNNLLRVTMLDSSERDYQLSTTEIDGFVNWFNSHTSTNTTSYMLNKKVGTQNSKEYLTFDKIISFEVMEL
ncbi:MAG: hypothetical protein H6Q70_2673 [Firmicutes bacterium]|nr:hypothetical protein [Bacillota bacterium]